MNPQGINAVLAQPQTPSPSAQPIDTERVSAIRIEEFLIDAQQPRHYLPADVRRRAAQPETSAVQLMRELLDRAATGDLEASGYLADLRLLAEDIGQIKVQQPVIVTLTHSHDRPRYVLIDGERRYWACLYLAAQKNIAPDKLRRMTIPAIVRASASQMSAAELERMQWSLNGQRVDMTYMDLAERVRDLYRSAYDHVVADRPAVADELGLSDASEMQDNEIAVQLAGRRIEEQTGRTLAVRTIFDYVGYAEKLTTRTQALARAYRFGMRELGRLTRLDADSQDREAERLAQLSAQTNPPRSTPTTDTNPGGRPTRAQRAVNVCVGLMEHVARMLPRLHRFPPEDLQVMRDAAQQAEASLVEYRQSIEAMLNQPRHRGE